MDAFELDISFLRRYDQGERGTCTAFSVISLLEYYFHCHGNDIHPSPQYLYALCILRSGSTTAGTNLGAAIGILKDYGICREENWPYNHHATPISKQDTIEGEPQITLERLQQLQQEVDFISCKNINFYSFKTPYNVNECQAVLHGDGDGKYLPMPVVIGCTVFSSFLKRENCDAWIHLPKPREKMSGSGHAMLITGYCDTPGFPSKGYFWALNSWGKSIYDDSGHPGMVKIPYEYYSEYVTTAWTIREAVAQNESGNASRKSSQHTNINHDTTEKNANNAKTTEKNASTSQAAHDHEIMAINTLADNFFSSMVNNLRNSPCPLPYDLFNESRIIHHSIILNNVEDKTGLFNGFIQNNIPRNYSIKGFVKVLPLCQDSSFRIVAATLAHENGAPVDMSDIGNIRNFIKNRLIVPPYCHTLLIVGATAFQQDCLSGHSAPLILCKPTHHGLWDFYLPQTSFSPQTIRFLLHALPGSANAYADRMAELANYWIHTDYITEDFLRKKLDLHSSVPNAFLDHWLNVLFARGGYAKDNEGHIYPPGVQLPNGACLTTHFT